MAHVLVVDDEPDLRDLLRLNLEGAGHRVTVAADGAEALAAVRVERPDAILLDVLMAGVDGWTVLERLKSSERAIAEVPVVMVTALGQAEDRVRGGIEGALRYLTKPFAPSELLAVLDELLAADAPAEPEQRRSVRRESLEALARLESGRERADEPRVRLTRLENQPVEPAPPLRLAEARRRLSELTPRQRELLELLAAGPGVTAVAGRLGTSRSSVYASLRRVVRRLGLRNTTELLQMLTAGRLLAPGPSRDVD